jgi:hypothetical protein
MLCWCTTCAVCRLFSPAPKDGSTCDKATLIVVADVVGGLDERVNNESKRIHTVESYKF